jgi:N-acetylglucosamine-6-phosphate deacetylase
VTVTGGTARLDDGGAIAGSTLTQDAACGSPSATASR